MSHTVLLYERMARLGEFLSLGERREEGWVAGSWSILRSVLNKL